jgi:hypothetical protein
MPFIERSKFEKHKIQHHADDDLHVHAISSPEDAAHLAALKLVMNTHLYEKLHLLDTEEKAKKEYIKTIINHKNLQHLLDDIIKKHAQITHTRAHTHQQTLGRGL